MTAAPLAFMPWLKQQRQQAGAAGDLARLIATRTPELFNLPGLEDLRTLAEQRGADRLLEAVDTAARQWADSQHNQEGTRP